MRTCICIHAYCKPPIDHTADRSRTILCSLPQSLTSAVQFLTCAQKGNSHEPASGSAAPQCGPTLSAVLGFKEVGGLVYIICMHECMYKYMNRNTKGYSSTYRWQWEPQWGAAVYKGY